MNEYYVYLLKDPRDEEVFYVGKGKGNRVDDHFKELKRYIEARAQKRYVPFPNTDKLSRMKAIQEAGHKVIAEKISDGLNEEAAFWLEEILIERIGRKFLGNGPLLNLEPGGDWEYPKIALSEDERITADEIVGKYPELESVLEIFPHVASEPRIIRDKTGSLRRPE